jgi:hypothetical protein
LLVCKQTYKREEAMTMTHQNTSTHETQPTGKIIKDPDDWTTGDEPMTTAQRSYLQTLCDEAQEPMDDTLTKAKAAKRIDALQRPTGRGMTAEHRRRQ